MMWFRRHWNYYEGVWESFREQESLECCLQWSLMGNSGKNLRDHHAIRGVDSKGCVYEVPGGSEDSIGN